MRLRNTTKKGLGAPEKDTIATLECYYRYYDVTGQ